MTINPSRHALFRHFCIIKADYLLLMNINYGIIYLGNRIAGCGCHQLKREEGCDMLSTYEVMHLMVSMSMLTISLISLIIALVKAINKEKNHAAMPLGDYLKL